MLSTARRWKTRRHIAHIGSLGPQRLKGRLPDEEANRITAYHEAGHTLVAFFTKDSIPLHKVTIIPRGQSLGHVSVLVRR